MTDKIEKLINETMVTSINIGEGSMEIDLEGGACRLLAEAFEKQFKDSGAKNYVELSFISEDLGLITVTMQRYKKLTPAGKVSEMKKLIAAGKIDAALAI